ncbi:LPS assembly lipoprotein LptE [Nitrospira sp. M1]
MKKPLHYGILILFTISLCTTGCGYRFSVEGRGPTLGTASVPEYEGPPVVMVIQPLANRSFESNLEYKYTEYLKDEFVVTGGASLVDNIRDADYVMKGAIESVTLPSLTFSQNQTQESRVTVNVRVQIAERRSGKILWQQTSSSSAEFFVGSSSSSGGGGGIQFNRVLQDRALEQAGQFVVEDLADRFLFAREQGVFTPEPTKPLPASTETPLLDDGQMLREVEPSSSPSQNAPQRIDDISGEAEGIQP